MRDTLIPRQSALYSTSKSKMAKSSLKSKAPAAVAPDIAEATPDLSSKTKKPRSKVAPIIGGNAKDTSKKRSTAQVPIDEEADAPAPSKKSKTTKAKPAPAISKKDSKAASQSAPVVSPSDDSEEEEGDVHLHGFSSDSDSSDDDEDDGVDDSPIDVGKLPTVAKDDATVKRKLEKAKKQPVRSTLNQVLPLLTLFVFRLSTVVCCTSLEYPMDFTKSK